MLIQKYSLRFPYYMYIYKILFFNSFPSDFDIQTTSQSKNKTDTLQI